MINDSYWWRRLGRFEEKTRVSVSGRYRVPVVECFTQPTLPVDFGKELFSNLADAQQHWTLRINLSRENEI